MVIKTRQHLAAIKPQERGLMLELMRFPVEILDTSEFKAPGAKPIVSAEMNMAKQLIESMSDKWVPAMYKDDYHELLMKVGEEKIHEGGAPAAKPKKPRDVSKVIDLVSVLQQSIKDAEGKSRSPAKTRKKAA